MIPTTDLQAQSQMPTCTYQVCLQKVSGVCKFFFLLQVLAGSVDGPPARFASIGDKLYHKWSCTAADGSPSSCPCPAFNFNQINVTKSIKSSQSSHINVMAAGAHGLLVHDCVARNDAGHEHALIDARGCSLDAIGLGALSYSQDLGMAWVESHAFKFADKAQIRFECALSLCLRAEGACNGVSVRSPPLSISPPPTPAAARLHRLRHRRGREQQRAKHADTRRPDDDLQFRHRWPPRLHSSKHASWQRRWQPLRRSQH